MCCWRFLVRKVQENFYMVKYLKLQEEMATEYEFCQTDVVNHLRIFQCLSLCGLKSVWNHLSVFCKHKASCEDFIFLHSTVWLWCASFDFLGLKLSVPIWILILPYFFPNKKIFAHSAPSLLHEVNFLNLYSNSCSWRSLVYTFFSSKCCTFRS